MKLSLEHIAKLVNGELSGDSDQQVVQLSTLEEAQSGSISFLSNPKYEQLAYTSKATAIIVQKDWEPKAAVKSSLIRVDDPYLAFTSLLEEYKRLDGIIKEGTESPIFIHDSASIGSAQYLGAFTYIDADVRIGKHVKIFPHCYIGAGVVIEDHTILYPGVKVYPHSKIGKYCTIQAGAIIGSHGFGFAPQPDGSYKNIPQVGNVILEDHVDIGANTTIDCGTLSSTIIRKGVKIDNLVQIAHNVDVGENTVIAAQTGVSGSSKIGKNVKMGGQVGVEGHIEIANKTTVTAKSGVTKSVQRENQILGGKFGFKNADYLKSYAVFKKLPEVTSRIEILEQKLLSLIASNKV